MFNKIIYSKMKKLEKLNFETVDNAVMQAIFGGIQNGGSGCTLDTITVTPTGTSGDGDDSWAGECDGALPQQSVQATDNVFHGENGNVSMIPTEMLMMADMSPDFQMFSFA
jgi:hypothetical protein